MHIHAEAHGVTVKVVNGVEVLEEGVSYQEKGLIFAGKPAFMNNKVALLVA